MKLAAFVLALALARPAAAAAPAPALPDTAPPPPLRAIAIAEDQRRWTDHEIAGLFEHASPEVRARAALAAARVQDSTATPGLVKLLADASVDVRREAAFALGEIGRRDARPALERVLADRDEEVVVCALEALGKLGDHDATPAVVRALGRGEPRVRGEAAVALWRLADTTAVDALLAHLREKRADVRWRVVYALEKTKLPARIVPAVAPLLADPDPLVRAHAARTLGRQKSRTAVEPLLGDATHGLGDPDVAVRVNVIRALAQSTDLTDGRLQRALLGQLAHADPYVRVTAASALGDDFAWPDEATPGSGRATLAAHLADPDAATRGACGRALVAHFGDEGLEQARALLADSSVYARVPVLDGLRAIPDARYAAPHGGAELAALAVRTLLGALDASRPLLERMTAAEVLGQLAGRLRARPGPAAAFDAAALEPLRAGVRDTSVLAAAACAGALGDWGDTASVARLVDAFGARAAHADADARQAIRDALRQLAGRAFADSLERAHTEPTGALDYAEGFEEPAHPHRAIVHTTVGDIAIELLGTDAPQTVRNFARLAGAGYYDGGCFHRVVPDFVIQDGDPTGTGSGGPGWTIRCEYNRQRYEAGMVGMALSGKDTGGSQWFVTLSPQPHLNGRYTIFGRVTKGMDVAHRVTQGTRITWIEVGK